jgi:hypothetical protein
VSVTAFLVTHGLVKPSYGVPSGLRRWITPGARWRSRATRVQTTTW